MANNRKKYQENVLVPSLRLALVFFVVSSLWIFLSDRLLGWPPNVTTYSAVWRIIAGWLFSLLMGTALFFLVKRILKSNYHLNASLTLSQSRYKTIIEKTLTGIVILDEKGIIKYVNPAFCRIFNYRQSEMLNHSYRVLVPPNKQKEWEKKHQLFFSGYTEVNGFYNVVNKEGQDLVVYVDAVGMEDEEGCFQQLLFMNDVSGQRKAESKLAESEKRYRVMMESLHEPVIISDSQGCILYFNQAFRQQFGDPPSNVPCYQYLFGEESLCALTNEKEMSLNQKFEVQINDKKRGRVFHVTHVPLEEYGDGVFGMTILQDLTDFLKAQTKAEESDRLKSSFLANMSHEIRTPLNSILGFSGLLLDDQITNDERKSFVAHINHSGNQLLKVIDNIIDYSFIESGNLRLIPSKIFVEELVNQLMQFALQDKALYGKDEVEVLSAVDLPNGYFFVGDSRRLEQVLKNLLDNALKFTDRGRISLNVSLSHNDLVFMVTDTGIGISSEMQKVVFERFRQEDETLSRNFGGSGLGLSISQQIVELMGGTIEMVSHVGRGTHLEVRLPASN